MSTSTSILSPNNERYRTMICQDIQDLFAKVLAICYPKLKDNESAIIESLEGEARKTLGDYAFLGVEEICYLLRKDDPLFFTRRGPSDVAQKIKKAFEYQEFEMIRKLFLNDAGILTFRLEGSWMAQRIKKMLKDGIDTWAPVIYDVGTGGKAVFVFPTNSIHITPDRNADMVRAIYMKDALVNMFLYSGTNVDSGFFDDRALKVAQESFTEKRGKIVSKMSKASIKGPSDGVYADYVHADLATLWHGVTIQEADVMIYMTLYRLREYIEQCHNAAVNEGWLPDDWKDKGTLTCCGFRTFGAKQEELFDLWHRLKVTSMPTIQILCFDVGYTLEAFFECAFKFKCLKSHRLADTIFKFEDIVDEKENTFLSLLVTQAKIRSVISSWPAKNSLGENLFNLNALAGKERELGLHLVEFTDFMENACGSLQPRVVCEYVSKLSKLFSYAFPHTRLSDRHENMLGLCKATEVVMDKCFHLLGIGPSSNDWTQEFRSFYNRKVARPIDHDIIPSSGARNEYPKSRLEIFSMTVTIKHPFDKGSIFGTINVVDTCRIAAQGWMGLDENDDCHISYFNREWHDPVHMYNGTIIPLENPSSVHSIPLSSSLKVHCLMKATSANNDQTYLLNNGECNADPAELMEFWNGESTTMCGTIEIDREDGKILLDYIAIKNAIDTKMQLIFNPIRAVRLRGRITASYGEDVLRGRGFLGQYKALIFEADQSKCFEFEEEPQLLPLYKSTLAVPANGRIRLRAEIEDVDTKKCIEDTIDLWDRGSSEDIWDIKCSVGSLKFILNWVR